MGVPENINIVLTPRTLSVQLSMQPLSPFFDFDEVASGMTPKTPDVVSPHFPFFTKSPLIDAIERGDEDEVSQLIAAEVDVNEKYVCNMTPLIIAIKNGHESIVEKLLSAGAEIDEADSLGRTGLMWACISYPQNEFIVWRLLNAGASTKGTVFGYGVSQKISSLLKEFEAGLLLPRDSNKMLTTMRNSDSKIIPDIQKLTFSFLTLTLPSLKRVCID